MTTALGNGGGFVQRTKNDEQLVSETVAILKNFTIPMKADPAPSA